MWRTSNRCSQLQLRLTVILYKLDLNPSFDKCVMIPLHRLLKSCLSSSSSYLFSSVYFWNEYAVTRHVLKRRSMLEALDWQSHTFGFRPWIQSLSGITLSYPQQGCSLLCSLSPRNVVSCPFYDLLAYVFSDPSLQPISSKGTICDEEAGKYTLYRL